MCSLLFSRFAAVILSTWRSGSTFLGDILNAMPGNYYHYEPLLYYDIQQVRGPPESTEAVNTLRQLLKCNYTGLDQYLEYGQNHNFLFTHTIIVYGEIVNYIRNSVLNRIF